MVANTNIPPFTDEQALGHAGALFGLSGSVRRLPGERDLNLLIAGGNGEKTLFKIANQAECKALMQFQSEVLLHLGAAFSESDLHFQSPVESSAGNFIETINHADGAAYLCRASEYVEGVLLAQFRPHSSQLLKCLGRSVAQLGSVLSSLRCPALQRPLRWRLEDGADIIAAADSLIADSEQREILAYFADHFASHVLPHDAELPRCLLHNDINDNNVIVDGSDPDSPGIRCIIDFGDMVMGWRVGELAIACAYALLDKSHPLDAVCCVVRGYANRAELTSRELQVLFGLICMRLCMSVSNAALQGQAAPDNDYLKISEQSAWHALRRLRRISPDFAHFALRDAAGVSAVPEQNRVSRWIASNQQRFAPILSDVFTEADLWMMDTSVGSPDLPSPGEPLDPYQGAQEIAAQLAAGDHKAGAGLYGEYRLIYASEDFVDATGHRRTLHLGIDLFQPAGSAVHLPLAGTVVGVADNAGKFDYGGTVIVSHTVNDNQGTLTFYTLYGHLGPASLSHLASGMRLQAGALLGRMGTPDENGYWAPHVHFQVITHLLGHTHTFAGVGAHAYRNVWFGLCPNPAALLGLSAQRLQAVTATEKCDRIRQSRQHCLSPSLSLSHTDPLHICRGDRQYLYDYTGRRYLDLVNNVSHVGHSHPAVSDALYRQQRILNTNTRYLYERIAQYSERLLGKFPDRLNVCFFVNSGSEANDLALRLARNFTGRHDALVLDHAYHGNLTSLIEISPYKHNATGGSGPPDHVHTVCMPDRYRHGGQSSEDRWRYWMTSFDEQLDAASGNGGAALFIAESMLGCGGQIVLPDDYLRQCFAKARNAGALCISDEVQVGFGRVGSHWWAFEQQGVVPDIVTLGKPIGNGHPLGAVITTREIADAFHNGMEYFNTFGGNPVSCAVGHAVLDIIATEGLMENAQNVSRKFFRGLQTLARTFPLIGDIRGRGLFIGVDLVLDRASKEYAPRQAAYIVNRMAGKGVLISTDGPGCNVLKIKPPMCIREQDAARFLAALEGVLGEYAAQPCQDFY